MPVALGYGNQSQAKLTALSDGGFLLTWHQGEYSIAGIHESIRVQRFSAIGQKVGPEHFLNYVLPSGTTVFAPVAVALPNGGYSVAWMVRTADGPSLRSWSFNADGSQIGPEIAVPGSAGAGEPAIAALSDGGFVLAWHIVGGVRAQRFDASGALSGNTIIIDSGPWYTSASPSVSGLPGGGFLAAWSEGGSNDIKARRFDADGTPQDEEFTANTTIPGQQYWPATAVLEGGGFVIAWTSSDPDSINVRAQLYNSAAAPLGGEILVNATLPLSQADPAVTALKGGGFLVTWSDYSGRESGEGGSGAAVVGQAFDASGARVGGEFQINSTVKSDQWNSTVAALPSGDVVVVWQDNSRTGSQGWGSDLRGQMFKPHQAITDVTVSATSVSEVAFANSTVATLGSDAAVNGEVRYELVGDTSGGAFRIVGDRIVLMRNALLDFETAPTVKVTVRAVESGGISYQEEISFAVLNSIGELRFVANDAATFFNPAEAGSWAGGVLAARLSDGRLLTVLNERVSGNQGLSQAQMVNEAGQAVGLPVHLSDLPTSGAGALSALPDGGFALVWAQPNGYSADFKPLHDVRVQRYDGAGAALDSPLVVNASPVGVRDAPRLTLLNDGTLLVTWRETQYPSGSPSVTSLKGVRLGGDGQPTGEEMSLLPDRPNDSNLFHSVGALPGGGFLVTWSTTGASPNFGELMLRLFDSSGTPLGDAAQVNMTARGAQTNPAVAMLASGGFVIAWSDSSGLGGDFSDTGVRARIFSANGIPSGGDFLVNSTTNGAQERPTVAALPTGGFIVSWMDHSGGSYGAATANLRAQIFTDSGARVGGEFQLNQATEGSQLAPQIVAAPSGSLLAMWIDSYGGSSAVVTARSFLHVTVGTAGADTLMGTVGDDIIEGLAGDDLIDGGPGADTMRGGQGNDIYVVDQAGDLVEEAPGEGFDEIRTGLTSFALPANVEALTYTGTLGAQLRGNPLDNTVTAAAADDLIFLQDGGEDIAYGGFGNDAFYMGAALSAGDRLDGGSGFDQVGLQGNYGSAGTPHLLSEFNVNGIEQLVLLPGSDTRFGDTAGNFYSYHLKTHDGNVAAGQRLTVTFNTLRAGENVTFDGSAETDGYFFTYGGLGNDVLVGGQQNDAFYFGHGRWGAGDRVDGQGGNLDQLGFQGNYSGANAIVFGADQIPDVEMLVLLSGGDTRFGSGGLPYSYDVRMHDGNVAAGQRLAVSANTLRADESLTFDGSAESDGWFLIYSGAGNDTIIGGAGNEDIWGGAGDDRITGGAGADVLRGGAGNDTFVYVAASDSTATAMDRILDFGAGDRIDLAAIDADGDASNGDTAFTFIGGAAFSGTAGELRAFQQDGAWRIEGDVTGNGAADLVISVTTLADHQLTAADFWL